MTLSGSGWAPAKCVISKIKVIAPVSRSNMQVRSGRCSLITLRSDYASPLWWSKRPVLMQYMYSELPQADTSILIAKKWLIKIHKNKILYYACILEINHAATFNTLDSSDLERSSSRLPDVWILNPSWLYKGISKIQHRVKLGLLVVSTVVSTSRYIRFDWMTLRSLIQGHWYPEHDLQKQTG